MPTTLQHRVKRPGQTLAATGAPGLVPSRLFYITDRSCGLRFLVDTGAEVSVLPPSRTERKHPQDNLTLQAVNSSPIATYGTRSLTLDLGLRRTFRWVFILANVEQPILGADFLRHFNLLVDMTHTRLVDATTQLHIQGILSKATSPHPSILPLKMTGSPFFLTFFFSLNRNQTINLLSTLLLTTLRLLVPLFLLDHAVFPLNVYMLLAKSLNTCWS